MRPGSCMELAAGGGGGEGGGDDDDDDEGVSLWKAA